MGAQTGLLELSLIWITQGLISLYTHSSGWTDESVHMSVLCLCCIQYIYACTSRHILSLLCLFFFFFALLFKPSIHSHYHSLMSLWVISTWLSVACRRTPDALPSLQFNLSFHHFFVPIPVFVFFSLLCSFASLLFVEEDHQLKIVFWCHLPKPVKTRYI